MRRGPKPKPPGNCPECQGWTQIWSRGLCCSCYSQALRSGKIQKLVKPVVPNDLTPIQEQVLIGHLLGDGCLYRDKATHQAYLAVTRVSTDLEYLEWTQEVFQDFVVSPIRSVSTFDSRTQKTYFSVKLRFRRCPVFTRYYEKWYPNGVKVVPTDLVLTPLIIAVWFSDDGSIRRTCSDWRFQIKLSTMGFTPEETDRLASMLSSRYFQYFSSLFDNGRKNLCAADAGSRALIAEIDSVLPRGMERKALWRLPESRFYHNPPEIESGWSKCRG